jgi:hypothetical protein
LLDEPGDNYPSKVIEKLELENEGDDFKLVRPSAVE